MCHDHLITFLGVIVFCFLFLGCSSTQLIDISKDDQLDSLLLSWTALNWKKPEKDVQKRIGKRNVKICRTNFVPVQNVSNLIWQDVYFNFMANFICFAHHVQTQQCLTENNMTNMALLVANKGNQAVIIGSDVLRSRQMFPMIEYSQDSHQKNPRWVVPFFTDHFFHDPVSSFLTAFAQKSGFYRRRPGCETFHPSCCITA